MSKADSIFIDMCIDIIGSGFSNQGEKVRTKWEDGAPAYTKKKFGVINRYDLSKEFPIITVRKTNWKNALAEVLWIYQKQSNNTKDLNSKIWDLWADENGSIGKAYGYVMAEKHQYEDIYGTQIDKVIHDLKHNRNSRRIMTSFWTPQYTTEKALQECAYSMTYNVTGNKLNAILNQRSSDVLVANNWNVVQYALLVHMLAQVSGLEVGELVHVIADAHIYDRHIQIIYDMIDSDNYKFYDAPKLWINPEVKDFYDFKLSDFELIDYKYASDIKNIPLAV